MVGCCWRAVVLVVPVLVAAAAGLVAAAVVVVVKPGAAVVVVVVAVFPGTPAVERCVVDAVVVVGANVLKDHVIRVFYSLPVC